MIFAGKESQISEVVFMLRTYKFRFAIVALIAMMAFLLPGFSNAQATLRLVGHLDPFDGDNRYADVWGEGNYAYIGSYNSNGNNVFGVMIFDISNPGAPRLAGHYNPSEGGRFQDVVVINGIGYFSSENRGGVHIVDVSNPANPVLLYQILERDGGYPNVHELWVADGILYEANSFSTKVKAFDVRNPHVPVFLRDIQTTDTRYIHAIVALNGKLYTSGWGGKTDIFDVRNILTTDPPRLGAFDSGTNSHVSWPSNNGQLLASARETTNGDVRLFDISNPANPALLSTISAQSLGLEAYTAHNPYIIGNMLFVSWYQAGLVVVDITDPRQPYLTGVYDTHTGPINGFDGCWGAYPFLGFDKVLLSDLDGGLYIVDATAALTGPRSVSAASYSDSGIAPKSIVAAFGLNLSPSTQTAITQPLPTSLADTTVQVQDSLGVFRLAPMFFTSPNQINYQIPAGTAPGGATVYVTAGSGTSKIGALIVGRNAPSIFTTDQSGRGNAVALDAFTFTIGPFNATQANGQPNIIAVFGTGLGEDATDVDGNAAATVQAMIDGQAAAVAYAGRAPGFTGLNQWNIVFPAGIASGDHRLLITRSGVSSNQVSFVVN